MKIISVVFEFDNHGKYEKMSKVLEHSIKKNCPSVDFELIKINPPKVKSSKRMYEANTVKLELWLEKLKQTKDDVIFMDCDMMVLGDLQEAFDYKSEWDVSYTFRDNKKYTALPMNAGIMFVRNNKRSVAFIEKWAEVNALMYKDIIENNGRTLHAKWRNIYAGMNQAAWGYLVEECEFDAKLRAIPCAKWNACGESWERVDDETKVVHIKSGLRTAVLSRMPLNYIIKNVRKCTKIWRDFAREIGIDVPDEMDDGIDIESLPNKNMRGGRRVRDRFRRR